MKSDFGNYSINGRTKAQVQGMKTLTNYGMFAVNSIIGNEVTQGATENETFLLWKGNGSDPLLRLSTSSQAFA